MIDPLFRVDIQSVTDTSVEAEIHPDSKYVIDKGPDSFLWGGMEN